jgi:GNAT superfamily N-acetyltransferase
MEYQLEENKLSADDFLRLRTAVGWAIPLTTQVQAGLNNSMFTVSAIHKNQVIAMGRLVGDGFTICYIQDLIVLPEYQGKGVGTAIIERLIRYIRDNSMPDTFVTTGLFSAQGKEAFYQKFGFVIRPNERMGAGMHLIVKTNTEGDPL